ncbi:YqaJ viral recombinase family protein [Streptomyces synnematoformans]|uniref:YqaJ viral recombinase family protein n=1 Tax=Streptomyces synnematoformans TaxID=415721 RepID=A0ABN2XAU0_9ACTN
MTGPLITPTARLRLPGRAPEEEWHAVRRTGVGGSDVAAIVGLDVHRGPRHVYLAKRGELDGRLPGRAGRAARRGHRLEGLVAEFFTEDTGLVVRDAPGTLAHADHPHWLANPDRIAWRDDDGTLTDPSVLECKTRTWRSAKSEDWTGDEPPDVPAIQTHWYLAVTGYERGYVAGTVDDDFYWWRIDRDDELIAMLTDAVDTFWHEHVVPGVPPPVDGSAATTDLLARLFDVQPEKTLEVDPVGTAVLLARRRELKERADAAADALAAVDNALKDQLGDAEVATAGGRVLYTWRANGNFASARFREAEPELAREYQRHAPVVDTDRLADEDPETFHRFRARRLHIPEARP